MGSRCFGFEELKHNQIMTDKLLTLFNQDLSREEQFQNASNVLQEFQKSSAEGSNKFMDNLLEVVEIGRSSWSVHQTKEALSQSDDMIKMFESTSNHSTEEAAKWCEEFRNSTTCGKVKSWFENLMGTKKGEEEFKKCFEEQVMKDPKCAIDTMKDKMVEVRKGFVEKNIYINTGVCIITIAATAKALSDDLIQIEGILQEMNEDDKEIDRINTDHKQLLNDINQLACELSETSAPPLSCFDNLQLRLRILERDILAVVNRLMANRKIVEEKRDSNLIGSAKNGIVGGIKLAEAIASGHVVSSAMRALSYVVPVTYFGLSVAQLTMSAKCHNALCEIEKRLLKGTRLQKRIDEEIQQMSEMQKSLLPGEMSKMVMTKKRLTA